MNKNLIQISKPIINEKECKDMKSLVETYTKITSPGIFSNTLKTAKSFVPSDITDFFGTLKNNLNSNEIYIDALRIASEAFSEIQERTARYTISEKGVINRVNRNIKYCEIINIDEICFLRSYDLAKVTDKLKSEELFIAFVEGAITGAPGFAGIPFNLVLSTFLYFRTVELIAMHYGYNVKENPDELVIAAEVFGLAMSPRGSKHFDEMSGLIGKIMLTSQVDIIKKAASKG